MQLFWLTTVVSLVLSAVALAEEIPFSGPQIGEELVSFEARAPFGGGENVQVLDDAKHAPTLLVFVHQATRPSVALVRLLMNYAETKEKEGLISRLVFLTDDPTESEAFLRRARGALPKGTTPLISTDGVEGPGAYGLNRKMTLTVLVGKQGKVTANFPLVQPSVQVDGPKIGHAILQALVSEKEPGADGADSVKPPTLKEMGFEEPRMAMRESGPQAERDAVYRRMMTPVIQKNATPVEVAEAARKVEDLARKNEWFKNRVYNAARMIVVGDKLANYGTETAQECLKKWAKELAPQGDEPTDARPSGEEPSDDAARGDRAEESDDEPQASDASK